MSNDTCPICLSELNEQESNVYEIDCGHKFHTNCIIKWFRSSKGQCPCCLDNPFKYKNYHSYTMFGLWNNLYIKERCSALRKNTKKKNCDPKLIKKFDKLKEKEEELKEIRKEKSELIKSEEYKELIKNKRKLDSKLNGKEKTILNMKAKIIADYPTLLTS